MTSIGDMPNGSKQASHTLSEPWDGDESIVDELKDMPRASLPVGYPADLSRSSAPESGSIGIKGMPIKHRKPPFTLKEGR